MDDKFWAKIESVDDCWVWVGAKTLGYGQVKHGKKIVYAHRLAYTELVGPIPDGLHLDHLCRVRNCVNPNHLEAVTPKENILRGIGLASVNIQKKYCPIGHQYDATNTAIYNGSRVCRMCRADYKRKWSLRRKEISI